MRKLFPAHEVNTRDRGLDGHCSARRRRAGAILGAFERHSAVPNCLRCDQRCWRRQSKSRWRKLRERMHSRRVCGRRSAERYTLMPFQIDRSFDGRILNRSVVFLNRTVIFPKSHGRFRTRTVVFRNRTVVFRNRTVVFFKSHSRISETARSICEIRTVNL